MTKYRDLRSRSRDILACAITALITRSSELAISDTDIKQVLYNLAKQDWRDHRDDHRQLELFPLDNYTSKRGGVK
jgi:hypothetical protein